MKKNFEKIVGLISVGLLSLIAISGCSDSEKVNNEQYWDDNNGLSKISDNVYLKHIEVNYDEVYVYADSNGTPLGTGPITANYQVGKSKVNTTSVDLTSNNDINHITNDSSMKNTKTKFVFKCNELEECENKIKIVKDSLN